MRWFLSVLAILSSSVFGEPGYTEIGGVTVRVSSQDAVSAKREALASATVRAFGRLMDRDFPEAAQLKGKLPGDQIQSCVYDYSVEREKFSGRVYIGEFTFRFSRDDVFRLLRSYGVSGQEEGSKERKVAVYTKDYLKNSDFFKEVPIDLFSKGKVVLRVSSEFKKRLEDKQIKFAEVDA